MAKLYERPNSPFFWIRFRQGKKRCRISTAFRTNNAVERRKAYEFEAKKTLEERRQSSTSAGEWDLWVRPWIIRKYKFRAKTQTRYLTCWRSLDIFLREKKIKRPDQLTRAHCFEYLDWRADPDLRKGKYKASHNTAKLELKLLRLVMREALNCTYTSINPVNDLDIQDAPQKIYPELSRAELEKLAAAILQEPEPIRTTMHRCFIIARLHGVRLNETNVNPTKHVRITNENGQKRGVIKFFQKGGKERVKPLHPDLIPLFELLQAEGATETYPAKPWGNRWTKFLRRVGLKNENNPNLCFHSLRVTAQNLLRRGGVSKAIRMEYLSHDRKEDVNDGYNRFTEKDRQITIDEMRVCHAAISDLSLATADGF